MELEKILVIGGNGFIGKNLIQYFKAMKPQIELVILSRGKNQPTNEKGVNYVCGDYGDKEFLRKLFKNERFDKVFHFANSSVPVVSNLNITGDIQNNLVSTLTLLEVMTEYDCHFIIYLSSGGAVYGELLTDTLKEDQQCKPLSAYGITKWSIEQYIALYNRNCGINYLIFRLSNPYGFHHNSQIQGIINIAVRKALKKERITIWGDGTQQKDYIFVEDVVSIMVKLLEVGVKNEVFNIGSGVTIALNHILEEIGKLVPGMIIHYEHSKSSDVMNFCLSIEKLNKYIDFQLTPFKAGLIKTIEWEKSQIINAETTQAI